MSFIAAIDELIFSQPGHLIRRANQLANAAFVEETAALGVTPMQYAMLALLSERPGIDATRISETIAIDRATIGNVVARLEARGLLKRRADARDRRARKIYITRRGAGMVEQVRQSVGPIAERMLGRLTSEQRGELMKLLALLVDIEGAKRNAIETLGGGADA